MKYCRNCGKGLDDNTSYCPECGAYAGQGPEQQPTKQNNEVDGNNTGFNVLSFFCPLIGLILYLVWEKQLPLRAKGCGKWALIGFIISVILSVISAIIFYIIFFGFIGSFA